MRELTAHPILAAANCLLGEGAFWDATADRLVFVDIKGRRISTWVPGTQAHHLALSGDVGFAIPAEDGSFVAGVGRDLCHVSDDGAMLHVLASLPDDTHRINDGTIAPDGTIWFGTMDDNETRPLGHYWSYAAGHLRRHDVGWIVTNGPALTSDDTIAYLAASVERQVFRTRLTGGAFGVLEPFVTFPPEWGHPDGLVVDDRDHIWIAHWDGGRVTCFSPDGDAVLQVRLPTARPTKCAFGMSARGTLLITTASIGLDLGAQPLAGALFACEVDATGPALPRAKI